MLLWPDIQLRVGRLVFALFPDPAGGFRFIISTGSTIDR